MKIAVAGLGVAGSYLVNRLGEEHDVVGFERQPFDKFHAVCAWGTSRHELRRLLAPTGIDFDGYVLHDGRTMHIDLGSKTLKIPLKGLCTYDKHRLEFDLVKNRKTRYGIRVKKEELLQEGFEMVIDATGVHRDLLPRLKDDSVIPCIEYKMRYSSKVPFDDFYIRPFSNDTGYLWYFPLEKGSSYVGAGDFLRHHVEATDEYNAEHPGEVVERIGRPIRFMPPKLCEPFFEGKVVGVGESIGTVFPILGEGIIPSLQCAEIFLQTMPDFQKYRRSVLREFAAFYDVYRLVRLKLDGKFNIVRHSALLAKTFRYMKQREDRFGLTIRGNDLYQIMKV